MLIKFRHMVLFTQNVKKIKGAAHKNGDTDGTWKQTSRPHVFNGRSPCNSDWPYKAGGGWVYVPWPVCRGSPSHAASLLAAGLAGGPRRPPWRPLILRSLTNLSSPLHAMTLTSHHQGHHLKVAVVVSLRRPWHYCYLSVHCQLGQGHLLHCQGHFSLHAHLWLVVVVGDCHFDLHRGLDPARSHVIRPFWVYCSN